MVLSGTSMAAAVVTGAVAEMLEKNPYLTPNTVKAILMYTAEKRSESPLEVGAGYLNTVGAVYMAMNINPNVPTFQYWIQSTSVKLGSTTIISGSTIVWGDTIVCHCWGDTIVWGDAVLNGNAPLYNQPAWGQTIVWGDSVPGWATTIVWDNSVAVLSKIIGSQTIVWDLTAVNDACAESIIETSYWDYR